MRQHRRFLRAALLRAALPLALLLAWGGLAAPVPVARAEDGAGEGPAADDLEAQIKAQMEKILRLMRDNEKALLEASVAGGRRPEGVEVAPPPGSAGMGETPPGTTPPPQGPPPEGEAVRRKMEEVLRATQQRAGTIPGELETLVKLIPT